MIRDLRSCARKVQAGSLQLSSIIKESRGDKAEIIPEMQTKIEEMEKENTGLKKCVEELKEQIQVLRQMYSNDDPEDGKKMKRIEREIKVLKEEKEKMRKEIEEMKTEKNKKDQMTKMNRIM